MTETIETTKTETPGPATQGSAAPGTATPGSATPGTATPGSATQGVATASTAIRAGDARLGRTAAEERRGGLGVWSPSVMPPIGVELSDEQKLACSFRILARDGFAENISGHITWQRPGDETLLVNPWGLWWREMKASDICTVDLEAKVVAGKWDVTPAIHIHTELHRRRPDARVVIHNHPYHVCVLAAVGRLPEIVHQSGTVYQDDLALVSEYSGEVDSPALGAELAEQIGGASVIVLASHGIIVSGPTIEEATFRAATIDRACRLAYDVLLLGEKPLTIPPGVVKGMKASILERGSEVFFAGAVRQLLREEPDVLQ
ncbi:MAG TPA: class II aldolase/adducin family protein [Acidimicrobiales bacterium]|nr:class II aldolase/adducin family protein [Acidimicrobiales bacterium]